MPISEHPVDVHRGTPDANAQRLRDVQLGSANDEGVYRINLMVKKKWPLATFRMENAVVMMGLLGAIMFDPKKI